MINTIYLDNEFNFLLLECTQEENSESTTKIYLNIKTDATTGQRLEISVAGGAVVTENIESDTVVNFELSQVYWADDNATEITPKNDDITGATITINFPKTFTTSAALNYISDTEFDIQAQNEDFAGGGGSGSGGSGGAAFDFVETIRNIGFRLLDEPSNVNAYFDEVAEEVQIKWTDPADIATNEPAPATWAGTVVVRKEGSAPLHRWDGVEIIDSTTRDEYSATALIDNTIDTEKSYYYGIFPYDTKGDYRFTKIIAVSSQPIPAPEIVSLVAGATNITVNYSVADRYTYDYITLVYKKNSAPADKTDGTAVSLSASDTSKIINGLDEGTTYYFKIFAQVTGAAGELESNAENATTGVVPVYDLVNQTGNKILIGYNAQYGNLYAQVQDSNWHTFTVDFDTPITANYAELMAVSVETKIKDIKLIINGVQQNLEDIVASPDVSHYKSANAWNYRTLAQYFDTDYNLALLPMQYSRLPSKVGSEYTFAGTGNDSYYAFKLNNTYTISGMIMSIQLDFPEEYAYGGVRLKKAERIN